MIPTPEIKVLSFKDFSDIIIRRSWLIVGVPLVILLATMIHQLFFSDIYKTTAMLIIKQSELELMNPKENPIEKKWDRSDFLDELELLQSSFVAEKVSRKLGLDMPLDEFQSMVDIRPFLRTNMVAINVFGRDPLRITEIANTWAEIAVEQDIDRSLGSAEYGVEKLVREIQETLKKLTESEKKLQEFNRTYGDLVGKQNLIDRINSQKERLEKQIVQDSVLYKEKHLKIRTLKTQIDELDGQLSKETAELTALQNRIDEYHVLTKEVRIYRQIYNSLMDRQKQLESARGLTISRIKIWAGATVPKTPQRIPVRMQVMVVIGGVFLGGILCFIIEYFDDTVKNPEEMEFYMKLPFIGALPYVMDLAGHGPGDVFIRRMNEPCAKLSDSGYQLKQTLLFCSDKGQDSRVFLPVSALPKEGKTVSAVGLGLAFARGGERVLLIDANMRNRALSRLLNAQDKKGLSEAFMGGEALRSFIVPAGAENLFILPAGETQTAVELLGTEKFLNIVEEAKKDFKRIIIGPPAICDGPESVMLSKLSDVVFFLIAYGKTGVSRIIGARKSIESGGSNVVGGCLNFVPELKPTDSFVDWTKKVKTRVLASNVIKKIMPASALSAKDKDKA